MAYEKQYWKNRSKATPINAERLNYMEDGIYNADQLANKATENIVLLTSKVAETIEKVDEAVSEAKIAKEWANDALNKVEEFQEQLTEAKELAQTAKDAADNAKAKAESAYSIAYNAQQSLVILNQLIEELRIDLIALTARVEKLEEDAAEETCVVLQAKKAE